MRIPEERKDFFVFEVDDISFEEAIQQMEEFAKKMNEITQKALKETIRKQLEIKE
jgi:hypothetical protein